MNGEVRDDSRSTLIGCAVVLLVELLFAQIDASALGPLAMWLDLGHAALAAVGVALLLRWRDRPTAAGVAAIFAVVALAFLPQTWLSELLGASKGALRAPLLPHEFVLLGIAFLVPWNRRFAFALLGTVAFSGLALWLYLGAGFTHQGDSGEPWMLLVFAGVAAVTTNHRFSRRELFHQLVESRAQSAALSRVAVVFRAFRDRVNTPLQTLEIGTWMLTRQGELSPEALCAMERAIEQLRELSTLLAEAEDPEGREPASALSIELTGAVEAAVRAMKLEHRELSR